MNTERTDMSARAVITRHSRSFSIASRLLPARVRSSVYSLYAWCRTVDDAVDEARSREDAERILNELTTDLDRIRHGQAPKHSASVWIEPLIVERRIEVKHAKELIAGMQMDLNSYRVKNDEDLHRYCYHAAGTVGLMMTRLMGVNHPAADRCAIALGVAMQLTNIARDVVEDAERGRSYLPGISDPLAEDPKAAPELLRFAVAHVLDTAERQYEVASAGIKYLPADCRLAIRLALTLYREIGREIERNDYQVLHGRTVVSKSRLLSVIARTLVTSIPSVTQETSMNELKNEQVSTVAQAKHAVYLGLSLTSIMAAALFVMVFMNPKDASYSYLPLIYSGVSLGCAILFNRWAARCEIGQQSAAG
jgi:phytoene synthase